MTDILRLESVTCLKRAEGRSRPILRSLDFTLEKNGVQCVIGPSGCGKSTLLRCIVGLDEISEGRILFQGRDVIEFAVHDLRRRIGFVQQLPFLFTGTVMDNLLYGPTLHHRRPADPPRFAADLLTRAGLSAELASRPASELSVGQQMRVSFARALANQPELLLLDEPTASLDRASAGRIFDAIERLNRDDGVAMLVVTHQFEAARRLGGRVAVMDEGRVCAQGALDELLAAGHPALRKILAEEADDA
ncbi:MAG: ATP-binding cassette domain-containing protein [bacterium]|nr:ATP-binding cassette domain-containing protein [bacterium]